jgi:hypothetical protein
MVATDKQMESPVNCLAFAQFGCCTLLAVKFEAGITDIVT